MLLKLVAFLITQYCAGDLIQLKAFSIDAILSEIKDKAPEILDLLLELRATNRHSDDLNFREMSVITSICTLTNARSLHCNGFQLLVGMMLGPLIIR